MKIVRFAFIGSLILLFAVTFSGDAAADTLDERAASYAKINHARDVDWYSPLEVVKGGHANAISVVAAADRSISADAIQKSIDYVSARGTVALLVWQGGKLQLAYYGPGSAPSTRVNTASMHKSVMSILYGAAVRDGYIKSIEEPASKYLPEWANDDRKTITIHNLMNMASGLEHPATPKEDPGNITLGEDIAGAALAFKAVEAPGMEFDYSNGDAEDLGVVLQRATGMRYAQYLSKALLQPLGTGDGRVWLDHPDGMAHTFCCVQLTAEDWLRIGLLLKDGGKAGRRQIVPAAWIEQMIAPSAANPNYGLLVWRASPYAPERRYSRLLSLTIPAHEPFLAPDMFFFDGAGAQRVYVSRAADLVIVRVGDGSSDWDDSYVPNLIMRGLRK